MTVHHGHVPLPLLIHARASWCGWRYEARDGKQTKVPIDPHTGRRAKTNDSTTWSDNETALAAVEKYGLEGVGYVFSEDDPFRGIDIDNCRNPETGSIAPWAQEMTASLTTYTEVSPSGTGLKCWLAGAMTGTRHRWKLYGGEVEAYDRLRFFTFTADHVAGTPLEIEERQAEFEALIAELDAKLAAAKPAKKSTTRGKTKKKVPESDTAVLKHLKPRGKCKRVLDGDYSDYNGDQSAAELMICGAIARVVGEDPERIDRVYRATAMMRAKWDERHGADGRTYGEMTIAKALEDLEPEAGTTTQKEMLLEQAEGLALYHTPEDEGFIALERDGHAELHSVMSKSMERWLRQQAWENENKAPSASVVRDALLTLDARACFSGEERRIGVRVIEYAGAVYLDLANDDWESVKITAEGWEIVPSPLLFRRGRSMKPLPTPVRGGSLAELRPFLNVPDEDGFILAVAYVVGALRPHGPYAILMLGGEQGSAKTFSAKALRSLVDPAAAMLKSVPTTDRELMIAAVNGWMMAFDNVSGLTPGMSDAFCRLATGGGLATRQLYSDAEEATFEATRPILVNGIDDLTGRADLLSRSIVLTLPHIESARRRTEKQLEAELAEIRPRLLGALCEAVACALRHLPDVRLENAPRMSDFATWIVAAEPALPWEAGRFLEAYTANQKAMSEVALEMDRVAALIFTLMESLSSWSGTATQLLTALRELPDQDLRGNDMPHTPRGISNRVHRLAPLLRERGLDIVFRKGTERTITIVNIGSTSDSSASEGARARIRKSPEKDA